MAEQIQETPEMMFELGKRFYLPGPTGSEDPLLALFYFQKAAEAGFGPAQRVLGTCYLEGRLTPVDFEKARQWLPSAARQNDGQAAYALARMYHLGQGVARDWNLVWKLLDMECARGLEATRVLKEQVKTELARPFGEIRRALEDREKIRRAGYDGHRQRFIQPWFTTGRSQLEKEEFEIWLNLTQGKIDSEAGLAEMSGLMETYYDQQEALHPAAGEPPA